MATQTTTDQMLLDAFRYVSSEMDAAERLRFEVALESDAAAQQALVDVVCLSEAVAIGTCDAILAKQQRTEQRRSRRHISALAALTACLAIACVAMLLVENQDSDPIAESVAPTTIEAESEVVSLWSDLHSDVVLAEPQPEAPELTADDAVSGDFPAWMIAASLTADDSDANDRLLDDELDEETL